MKGRSRFDWIGRAVSLGVVFLGFLWLFLYYMDQQLPKASPSDIASVTQTMTTYTMQAAFAIPIAVLVAIVGALVTQERTRSPRMSAAQQLGRVRQLDLMFVSAMASLFSILVTVFGIVVVSGNLFAGPPLAVDTAVRVDGTILSAIVIEVILVYLLVFELISAHWPEPGDDSAIKG